MKMFETDPKMLEIFENLKEINDSIAKTGKNGRPSKLGPERKKLLLTLISNGFAIKTACLVVGIDYSTFTRWINRGKEGKGKEFVKFYREIEVVKVLKQMQYKNMLEIMSIENSDANTLKWLLTSLDKKKWNPNYIDPMENSNDDAAMVLADIGEIFQNQYTYPGKTDAQINDILKKENDKKKKGKNPPAKKKRNRGK